MSDLLVAAQRATLRVLFALPEAARAALVGRPPVNDRGVALNPRVHTVLAAERRVGGHVGVDVPEVARRGMRAGVEVVAPKAPAVNACEATILGGVPARRYATGDPTAPLMLYLHGGGWAAGGPDTHDGFCRRLCAEGGLNVVSLDYALAPERPFPAGLDDVLAAWRDLDAWAARVGWRPRRRLVGGDSAGGNLTTALCVRLGEAGEALPDALLLVYPAVDLRGAFPSRRLFAEGFLLDQAGIDRYEGWYASPSKTHPHVTTLLAPARFPPAVVVTAGFDPLRDEGEAMAARIGDVVHVDAADQVHGFVHFDAISPSADAWVARTVDATARLARR